MYVFPCEVTYRHKTFVGRANTGPVASLDKIQLHVIRKRWRKGGGGSNSLTVYGPETKRTNSRNMPRLIPIAESEAK